MLQSVSVVMGLCLSSLFVLKCLRTLGRYEFHSDFMDRKTLFVPPSTLLENFISAWGAGEFGENATWQNIKFLTPQPIWERFN